MKTPFCCRGTYRGRAREVNLIEQKCALRTFVLAFDTTLLSGFGETKTGQRLLSRFRFEPMLLLPPLVFAGIAFFYLHEGQGFNDPSSGQAPALYGHAMLVLSALVFAIALLRSFSSAPAMLDEHINPKRVLAIYGILCSFIGLIFAAGFYVAVPVFLLLFLLLIAQAKPLFSVAGAALGLALLWGVFGQLLHMRVFMGYLF